ncbi:PQQ-binding-like beta-propeller repeat protein [Kitasatospora sp. NPDC101801]|uniref:outer membrane protein assembly factor BamB family protein n=1 Tax=Kitasatospora sp. NPDC101801 TaxID=3364103 RepID=UPI00381FA77A
MAQDHSGTAGQEPVGYDYQQGWYPTQEQSSYGEQGYGYQDQQWQSGMPQQREPDQYQQPVAGYEQQLYAPTGYQEPQPYEPSYQPSSYQPQSYQPPVEPDPAVTEPTPEPAVEAAPVAAARVRKVSAADRLKDLAASVISGEHAPGKRALLIRAGAGVAALAVLLTAGVMVTADRSEGEAAGSPAEIPKTFTVAHAKAWAAEPATALAAGADDTLVGSWLLGDAVVRADSTGVHAYGLADGKPGWTLAPPVEGAVPCGLSPTVGPTGLGAALFRVSADPKSACTVVSAVDTKTGKAAWSKPLSDTKDAYGARVAVLEDKVVAVGDDRATAWAAADGKDLWTYGGQGKFCTLSGGASGKTVVLHSTCADSVPADQAVALNAADGKLQWWRGLNNQPKTVSVLSAEPAVVLTTGAQPADDRIFAWGATGDPAAEIPVTAEGGRLGVTRGSFDATPTVFFDGQTLLTTQTGADGSHPAAVAYDLTTGKSRWRTQVAERGKSVPVGVENGALLLAGDERLDQPAHLTRYAVTDGRATAGGGYPQGTGSLLTSGRVLTGGGKVVVLPEHSANFGVAAAFQAKG